MGFTVEEADYIEHYGVLGMKWGVRRYQPYPKGEGAKGVYKKAVTNTKVAVNKQKKSSSDYRQKVKNINSREPKSLMEKREHRYLRDQDKQAHVRVVKNLQMNVGMEMTKLIIQGKKPDPQKVVSNTIKTMAKQEVMAKSVASKYNQDGTRKKKAKGIVTREELVKAGIVTATAVYEMAPIINGLLGMAAQSARNKRYANEEKASQILKIMEGQTIWLNDEDYTIK